LAQRLDSLPWQCSISQGSVKQFLAKKLLLKRNSHPIPLIWLRMSSSCFQK